MDERFGRKGLWIGLGVLGLVFLCLMACGLLTVVGLVPRPAVLVPQPGAALEQPQGSEDGAVPPAQAYDYGRPAAGWHSGGGFLGLLAYGISFLFKVAFWGLLLMLLLGLVRRMFWGPRHWCRPGSHEHWKDHPHAAWRAWHPHGRHPGAKPDTAAEEEDPGAPNAEYAGPQV
ncbi:MAG: hypothetical protein ACK2UC_08940 [Anaerolineae bacterium]|jgi:hypothetical protein